MKHVSMQINTNSGQSIRVYRDPCKPEIVVEIAPPGSLKYEEAARVPIGKRLENGALDTAMRILVPNLVFATSGDDDGPASTGSVPAQPRD